MRPLTFRIITSSIAASIVFGVASAMGFVLQGQIPDEGQARLLKTFRSEFVPIKPGEGTFPRSFTMGRSGGSAAERPAHEVTFTYQFEIAKYEVTQDLWQTVMGSNPSRWKGSRNSVEMLSFHEAVKFCRRVTQLMRQARLIEADQVVRLPTEAEWEYAARAGTSTRYSFGDDVTDLGEHAWYTGNAAGNDPPVGAKKPNPWRLYDVHGYLWEWCHDAWHDTYEDAPGDGSAWTDALAKSHVIRGGSWKDKAELLTSSFRRKATSSLKDDAVGLRCVIAKAKLEKD